MVILFARLLFSFHLLLCRQLALPARVLRNRFLVPVFLSTFWAKAAFLNLELLWTFPMTSVKVKGARKSKCEVPHAPGLTEEHISPE